MGEVTNMKTACEATFDLAVGVWHVSRVYFESTFICLE